MSRAAALRLAATASSRSRQTTSAPRFAALQIFFSESPGREQAGRQAGGAGKGGRLRAPQGWVAERCRACCSSPAGCMRGRLLSMTSPSHPGRRGGPAAAAAPALTCRHQLAAAPGCRQGLTRHPPGFQCSSKHGQQGVRSKTGSEGAPCGSPCCCGQAPEQQNLPCSCRGPCSEHACKCRNGTGVCHFRGCCALRRSTAWRGSIFKCDVAAPAVPCLLHCDLAILRNQPCAAHPP